MTKNNVSFGALHCRSWAQVWFCQSLLLLLLGNLVGSWGESSPWTEASRSSHLENSFTPMLAWSPQIPYDNNVTEKNVRRTRRSSASASTEDSILPPNILTASHLSSLRDLVSDKKITVRLGLRVFLSGSSELLDNQLPLFLSNKSGLYNTGHKFGLFSMRIVGIKKVTSKP